ncbi:hypothetical protein MGEO_20545 [Marivita geojedonensis]|uniref:Uncharacterized protein n=1 Tax=Marivita geojedonensis TaxID=1123756 RepID=A0A1X4N890_9RHOB|nr:hypothetical protein MGEO_20545 [Marivita geojedonensis]
MFSAGQRAKTISVTCRSRRRESDSLAQMFENLRQRARLALATKTCFDRAGVQNELFLHVEPSLMLID